MFDKEMQSALATDGEKLRAMTGEDHGPWDISRDVILCGIVANLEEERDVLGDKVNAIRKVRDGYANQARFADIDCAVHFREFVRRIDAALATGMVSP